LVTPVHAPLWFHGFQGETLSGDKIRREFGGEGEEDAIISFIIKARLAKLAFSPKHSKFSLPCQHLMRSYLPSLASI